MRLAIGCLCDWAGYTEDRKLILVGIFEGMSVDGASRLALVPLFPCYLVVRIENAPVGKHRVGFRVVDGDRRVVVDPEPMEVDVVPRRPGYPVSIAIVAPIRGLAVPGIGDYEILILADGVEVGTVPLHVDETPEAPDTKAGAQVANP